MYIVYTGIMKVNRVTATEARKNWFEILKSTKKNKQITEILLDGEVVAEVKPKIVDKFDWNEYLIGLEKADKVLAKHDWSDIRKVREKSRRDRFPGW